MRRSGKIDWLGLAVVALVWALVILLGLRSHNRGERPHGPPKNNPWYGTSGD